MPSGWLREVWMLLLQCALIPVLHKHTVLLLALSSAFNNGIKEQMRRIVDVTLVR